MEIRRKARNRKRMRVTAGKHRIDGVLGGHRIDGRAERTEEGRFKEEDSVSPAGENVKGLRNKVKIMIPMKKRRMEVSEVLEEEKSAVSDRFT